MKKIVLLLTVMLASISASAQMTDDFESNQFGWTESTGKRGMAIIKDGVMHLESKAGGKEKGRTKGINSTCYAPLDFSKPFILSVEALAKKIDDDRIFGILLDYEDDQNYMLFFICEGEANLEIVREDKVIGRKQEALKLKKGKKIGVEFEVEYKLNELIFKVNGVRAMEYRRKIGKDEFMLGTSGIGFYARGGQIIDFDNLKIMQ